MRIIAIKKRSRRTSVERFIGDWGGGGLNAVCHAERRGKGEGEGFVDGR